MSRQLRSLCSKSVLFFNMIIINFEIGNATSSSSFITSVQLFVLPPQFIAFKSS
ncbi:hypothetical protein BP00DRAFT_430401 [Aspergillus indologenus CBS 114.80]|uniref:Uncharacterized protein n=1 Tax=Aspergillus indologenus CBS 114.80 TaxID=1450541 RepID=A0A2V5HW98_9EURO|nr:hypothetical protein BP00DRAFT_430401 [Aspergillus indologenus CBS 114.80]